MRLENSWSYRSPSAKSQRTSQDVQLILWFMDSLAPTCAFSSASPSTCTSQPQGKHRSKCKYWAAWKAGSCRCTLEELRGGVYPMSGWTAGLDECLNEERMMSRHQLWGRAACTPCSPMDSNSWAKPSSLVCRFQPSALTLQWKRAAVCIATWVLAALTEVSRQ